MPKFSKRFTVSEKTIYSRQYHLVYFLYDFYFNMFTKFLYDGFECILFSIDIVSFSTVASRFRIMVVIYFHFKDIY